MWKAGLLHFLKGMAIGAAEVVPGVSGGTIAFVTGIYRRLLEAIKSVDGEALKLLFTAKFRRFFQKLDGPFLTPLLLGMFISLVSLAKLVAWAMENQAIALWSFFFGLILASVPLVLREVDLRKIGVWLFLVIGAVFAWWLTGLRPFQGVESPYFLLLAGAIAISALILPGVSGSFLLLIMGQYAKVLEALNNRDWLTLGLFAGGCLVGLVLFSRFISWLLSKAYDLTVALLAGFMLGSLRKIWPWKIDLQTRVNSEGELVPFITKNVTPNQYAVETGIDAQPLIAAVFFLLALLIVWGLHLLAKRIDADE